MGEILGCTDVSPAKKNLGTAEAGFRQWEVGVRGEDVVLDPETFHLLMAAFYEGSESWAREQGKRN